MADPQAPPTVFLLSPVRLNGKRGRSLLGESSQLELAAQLRTHPGPTLAAVFSFVSGLYFRGKEQYARRFGSAKSALPAALVMTAGGGLCSLDERITLERLQRWAAVAIDERNPNFSLPLVRQGSELLQAHDERTRFVLLGSVATNKYVEPLLDVFGERLFFPREFAGKGDMARGSLMLRAVRDGRELDYSPVVNLRSSPHSEP